MTTNNTAPSFLNIGDGITAIPTANFGGAGVYTYATSLAVLPNGNIISALSTNAPTNPPVGVAILDTNGNLITNLSGFGANGVVTMPTTSYSPDFPKVAVDVANSKFVLVGYQSITKYNFDGTKDTSFATSGTLTENLGSTWNDISSIQFDSAGKLLITNSNGTIARFNSNGSVDSSFASSGVLSASVDVSALQSDGKILIANWSGALSRYNQDGTQDTSFASTTVAAARISSLLSGGSFNPSAIQQQADGKILISGTVGSSTLTGTWTSEFAIARFNTDGSLDTSFGGTGIKGIPTANGYAQSTGLEIQPDGKILLSGMSNGVTLMRLNTDGSFDNNFGTNGTSVVSWNLGINRTWDIALQPDGKILVSGDGNTGAEIVRLMANGALDTSFSAQPLALNAQVSDVTYKALSNPVPLASSGLLVSDAGLAAQGNYGGSSISLARHGGANSQDVFSAFGGHLSALTEGSALSLDNVTIGTVSHNSGGSLSILFNGSASQAQVDTVLSSIAYSNQSSSLSGSIQLDWTFSDGNTGTQGVGGALTTTAYTTVEATSPSSVSQIYVDLSLDPNHGDYNSSSTSVSGGPNGFYYDSNQHSWSSQYYRWPGDPTNPTWVTNQVTLSANGNTPILPAASQLQAIGEPLYYGYWSSQTVSGNTVWTQQPVIHDTNADLGLIRIKAEGNYATAQLDFAPWVDAATRPTYFSLTAAGAQQTTNWVSLPSVYDYNSSTQTSTQISGLKAKVVADATTGYYDLLIGHFDSAGNLLNNLTGYQMTEVLQQVNLVDTNTAAHQSAYSYQIDVSNNAQVSSLTSATWYGASGAGQAGETTVYFDNLAPTPSTLYVAQNSVFLAMNGTGSGNNQGGNTASHQWQGVVDSKLLADFTATVNGTQVQILNIQSQWNGYELDLASPVGAGQTVTLTYTPPAGTVGVNQVDGVVQDEAGNDAAAFTISGTMTNSNNSVVVNAASGAGYTNDDNLGSYHYFKGTGPEVNNAESLTLVSFIGGRATFQFNLPYLTSGSPGLDGITISGATSIKDQFEAVVDFKAGTTPFASGYFTSVNQTISASSLPNGIRTYLDTINNNLADLVSFKNTAIGNNGSSQVISTQYFNGTAGITQADNLSNSAGFIGNDTFYTGYGNDTIYGYGGDDTFNAGTGTDTLDGGFGSDTVSFDNQFVSPMLPISVTLGDLLASTSGTATSAGLNETLISIENVVGSISKDVITGNQANNILSGGAGGNDTIYGGAGSDTLIAGLSGNDTLDGGDGLDTAILNGDSTQWTLQSYSGSQVVMYKASSSQQVTITNTVENISFSNASTSPIVYDVASIIQTGQLPSIQPPVSGSQNTFVGSSGNDYLYGNNLNDTMWGMGGNDTLRSGTGNDTLIGGSGNNVLIGGAGNDTYSVNFVSPYTVNGVGDSTAFTGLFNGANQSSQTIVDSSGVDTLSVVVNDPGSYNSNYYLNIRRGGVNGSDFYLGIRDGSQSLAGQDAWFGKITIAGQYDWNGLTYTGNNTVENLIISGSGVLNGTVNIALGAGSTQTVLYGTSGSDFVAGFGSGNTIYGGDGNDYLAGSRLDTQVELDVYNQRNGLTGPNAVTLDTYTATGVTVKSNAGALIGDTLFGGSGNDILNGYYGNDYLDGGTGADTLMGWGGNDTYVIDNTGDIVQETGGNDTIITSLSSLDLRNSQYAGVENLTSNAISGSNNTLYGTFSNNVITGGAGNDTIDGVGGTDTLIGGAGNDTIILHASGSTVDGGDGNDTLQLASDWNSSSPISLTSGSISNIENVVYSGIGNFVLTGNDANNTLTTGSGNDTLDGGLGNDTLIGNGGNDTYTMTFGANLVGGSLVSTGGSDTFIDYSGTSTLKVNPTGSASSFTFSERGTDGNIYTRTYADGLGRQLLSTQTLTGNFGNEGTQFSINVNGYTVSGSNGSATYKTFTEVAGNTVYSYNANYTQNNLLIGSTYSESMTGGAGSDWIEAGSGNDTIFASGGYDRIDGGLGNDVAAYGSLDNLSAGVKGIMVLATDQGSIGSINDYYVFKNQNYTTFTSSTVNTLLANGSADYLQSVETIAGTAQSDLFIGGLGNDWFAGRGGLDTFYGGLSGERSTDWVDYSSSLFTLGITANLGVNTGTTNLTLGGIALGTQLNTITGTVNTQMGPDTLYNIEGIKGTSYNDTLIGSTASNWLRGGLGNDILIGVGNGLPGVMVDHTTDWADYWDNTSGVTVNLGVGTNAAASLNTASIAGVAISGLSYGTSTGGDGNDTLIGIQGVRGGSGNDVLIGGAGNDWLAGGQGSDTLIGGAGSDTASYKWATGAVTVNLGVGTYNYSAYNYGSGIDFNGQTWGTASGADGYDYLVGIDRVVGSRFDDTLTGNSGDNVFRGLDGNDTIDGGNGSDWISYSEAMIVNNTATGSSNGITVDLSSAKDANGYISVTVADGNELLATAGTDKLKSIENITGTIYNDTLIGDAGDNTLQGFGGNDVLKGGAGNDTADFKWNGSGITATLNDSGINNDSIQNGTVLSSSGNDALYGIESIRGSEFADTITGSSGANTIDGGAGNDTLDGGGGIDTLSYRSALGGVTVTLGDGNTQQTVTGAAGTDLITHFENIIGSGYSDTLSAYIGGSVIDAGAGNDTISGNAGDDILRGGLGNDLISGGAGTDRALFSGLYTDYSYVINTANTSDTYAGVTLVGADGKDIVKSDVEYIAFDNSSGVVMDVVKSVQYGTAIFVSDGVGHVGVSDPTITGTTANDILTGSSVANQTLIGLAGNDVLDGGGGTATGSAGGDTLIGGLGNDTYVVYSYADKVVEDYSAGTDTVQARVSYILPTNVENLTMTYFNSGLAYLGLGNSLDNSMTGGAGADKLYGRDGNDVLSGLSGNDYLSGGNGNDTLYGGDGNDALYGNAGSDTIYGGAGNDILDAGTGYYETLAGGTGDDIYIVNDWAFNYYSKMIENANEGNDTVITSNGSFTLADNVENLMFVGVTGGNGTGNSLANVIVGNTGSNTLDGGAGNDTLYGDTANTSLSDGMAGGTSDYLIGGAGNDVLWGQSGDDTLDGGTGNDTMYGGTGNDTYYVDSTGDYAIDAANLASGSNGGLINTGGVDWIYASATVEMTDTSRFQYIENVRLVDTAQASIMTGSDYYSTEYLGITGTAGNNILTGNQYDNWINGLAGDDTINGGGGTDAITGGLGNDTLDGGYGTMDLVIYGTDNISDSISKNDGRYGYDLLATLANHNGDGIKANLNYYDYRFDANNVIKAYTVTGSANVNSGSDLVYNMDAIIGTNFNDTIVGTDGENFISGGRGNDTLVGAYGFDWVGLGGNSNYGLTVDLGAMHLADNSVVSLDWAKYQSQSTALVINLASLSTAANTYYDGTTHSSGAFISDGGNGLGTLTAWGFEGIGLSENNDTLYGTTGNDYVQGFGGNDVMFGGDGNDVLYGNGPTTGILAGTDGVHDHDTIYGGNGSDTLYAGAGSSTLLGETGDDSLIGAYGNDTLLGGDGNDYINGAEGNDVLNGGTGYDNIYGGAGNDVLIGGGSYDWLYGGAGNDTYLYTGNEYISENYNEGTDNVLVTTNGYYMGGNIENAALANMPGATPNLMSLPSYLYGNEQDNVLLGNTGDNTLGGNGGNDTIAGFGGDDTIYGGYGNDLFALTLDPTHSIDPSTLNGFGGTIEDFNRYGESDHFLLNFLAGGSGNTGFHYQLNVGYGASFINGDTISSDAIPEAMITYDPGSGLLQIEFQHETNAGSGHWTYAGDNGNTNLSFIVNGANDYTPATNINAASFTIDPSIDLTHPMQDPNSYWGTHQV